MKELANTAILRVKLFFINLPETLSESFVWFIMSYIFPVLQIFIIWGIKGEEFSFSMDISNILLVTNASLYTAIILIVNNGRKDKRLFYTCTLIAYIFTIALFVVSMIEITKQIQLFSMGIYLWGTVITSFLALFFALISKYDEVKARSRQIAKEGKERNKVIINGKEEIKI